MADAILGILFIFVLAIIAFKRLRVSFLRVLAIAFFLLLSSYIGVKLLGSIGGSIFTLFGIIFLIKTFIKR